jgi:type IV pilus assembly protein PilO
MMISNINFRELTIDDIAHFPMGIKIGVAVILGLVVLFLAYFLLIKDNITQFGVLQTQEITLKSDFEVKQHEAMSLSEYRSQLEIMNDRLSTMIKQLPAKNEMPGLLEEISKTGVLSGLRFELFAPQPEVSHDFYYELPIKISVAGTYNQLAEFISKVAQMSRIVTLHDFSITSEAATKEGQKDKETATSKNELIMNITAKIYRYRTK